MIKHMDTEPINMPMERLMWVSGSKTNNMELESKNGQMLPNTKDNIKMERNTEMVA